MIRYNRHPVQYVARNKRTTSSLAVTETPRELGDFKGMGQFEAKLPLHGGMIIQLCRWTFSHKETS